MEGGEERNGLKRSTFCHSGLKEPSKPRMQPHELKALLVATGRTTAVLRLRGGPGLAVFTRLVFRPFAVLGSIVTRTGVSDVLFL